MAAALAGRSWEPRPGAAFHLSHPRPVSVNALAQRICVPLDIRLPEHDQPSTVHRALTRNVIPELTDHQFSLLAEDHWYESNRIWRALDIIPDQLGGLDDAVSWYRTLRAA